ncbi:MAG: helix-turn-helix transcriptional regulator [Anderseniella sp.]|nr:helix-turn-helix transcriptional regulator [Anderseniella sp.]
MTEMVTIPKAEYARLKALAEERVDVLEATEILARIKAGAEELVPSSVVDRLLSGASPLEVWRQHRGMSQRQLAQVSGVNRIQIIDIEAGRKTGSVHTLKKLAEALGIDIEDLIAAPCSASDQP